MKYKIPGLNVARVAIIFLTLSVTFRAVLTAQELIDEPTTENSAPLNSDSCMPTPTPLDVLLAIEERELQIEARERSLADAESELSKARSEANMELAKLIEAEDSLSALIEISYVAAENDLAKLVSVYEAMKPDQASLLFSEMPPEFAAGFLGRMNPASAAGIMARLEPRFAYAVSADLAGRNAQIHKD